MLEVFLSDDIDATPRARGSEVVIGRGVDCDLVLNDPLVSRQHVRLRHDGPAVEIRDLRSSNGTHLLQGSADEMVRDAVRMVFPRGESVRIRVGDTVLEVVVRE